MKKIYLVTTILTIALLFAFGIGSFMDADAAQLQIDTPTLKPTVKATNTPLPKVTSTPTVKPTNTNTPTVKPTLKATNTPLPKVTSTPKTP